MKHTPPHHTQNVDQPLTEIEERQLGIGLTEAEAELGLCEPVVSVPDVWSRLYAEGVRGHAVTGGNVFAALHVATVVWLDNRRFEFAHNLSDGSGAAVAIVVPMLDSDGRTHDFVAADLDFKRAARWRATLSILGADRIYGGRIEPLRVFPDVLEWLRADRDGIVISGYASAARILCDGEPLAVDDAAFGRELEAKLRIGPPRILLRRAAA